VHFSGDDGAEGVGELGALLVHAEETVDFCFDALPEVEVVGGVAAEFLFVLVGEGVLAVTWVDLRA
jgi:hypothetical protein